VRGSGGGAQDATKLEAVHRGHHDVGNDEIRIEVSSNLERSLGRGCGSDPEPRLFEPEAIELELRRTIVDDQHLLAMLARARAGRCRFDVCPNRLEELVGSYWLDENVHVFVADGSSIAESTDESRDQDDRQPRAIRQRADAPRQLDPVDIG